MYDKSRADRAVNFIKLLRHTKGEFAMHPFNLLPFQEEIVRDLIGTLNEDGNRQYREAFIFLPRKNGKSELIAGLVLYFLFFDNEYGAEIYSCANDREQASLVFQTACAMIRMNKTLSAKCKIIESQKRIIRHETNSFYKAISAEASTKHGFNAHVVIFDEIHEAKNRDLYDVMKTSMGARSQPMFISITTAGVNTKGICYQLYDYSKKIKEGTIVDPTFYPVLYYAEDEDDPWDEATWYKCNPALGIFRSVEEFRQSAIRAMQLPTEEAKFRRLYLNQWVNGEIAWISMKRWYMCNEKYDIELLLGKECHCGLDLSATTDLTSVNLEFRLDNGKYLMINHNFMPKNRVLEKEKQDRVPYSVWIKQGFITETEGDVVDYEFVKQYIREQATKYVIKEICFDPWNATQISNDLENEGFTTVQIRQGYQTLSEATKDIGTLILQQRIIHNDNPVLSWAMSNCIVRQDPNGNIALDKAKAKNRIDPASAMINSHVRARLLSNFDLNDYIMSDNFSL
jgi:phage terminase large subunit-like protein